MLRNLSQSVSTEFIWRRIQSITGLWLVVFLTEHLTVNSQAALWIGDDGHGFVRLVNFLESLPYLQVVESILIGIPLLLHTVWGIRRALSAKFNSLPSDGSTPALHHFARNHAFTWQRLTSWILLVGIIVHVVQMRFLDYPKEAHHNTQEYWTVSISSDAGLVSLSERLGVTLYTSYQIAAFEGPTELAKQLHTYELDKDGVVAVASTPGTAMLLTVRDAFKSPWVAILYSIFVLAAVFHASNGLWACLITWGAILSYRSQKSMVKVAALWGTVLALLGLCAIWGSYWINLRS
jgi:succinate dehydrogenase / fumarate reductase cytochrome b subunit